MEALCLKGDLAGKRAVLGHQSLHSCRIIVWLFGIRSVVCFAAQNNPPAPGLGTCVIIFLGESVLANEVLAGTKGRGLGYGWVSFGFGMSFYVAILMFDYISAHVNPAMLLALWALGKLDAGDVFALAACEFLGAFVGAVLVWLLYLPHFKSIPAPRSDDPVDNLLRNRNGLEPSTLKIVSYNANPPPAKTWRECLKDVPFFLDPDRHDEAHIGLVERALGRDSLAGPVGSPPHLRRRSVQVADLHERIKELELSDMFGSSSVPADGTYRRATGDDLEEGNPGGKHAHNGDQGRSYAGRHDTDQQDKVEQHNGMQAGQAGRRTLDRQHSSGDLTQPARKRTPRSSRKRLDAAYEAAIRADQNAKLSIFATRPAIPAPLFNWLAEFLATTMLIGGALLISAQDSLQYAEDKPLFVTLDALYTGLFIVVLILGMGGPTGCAMNPARDFAPRLAHWLLPISGKGSSEWSYAWIPFTAGLVGGLAGGGLFAAINQLNHSQVQKSFYTPANLGAAG
ncbi:hypothetical protein WJX72_003653 [[Myrmecia] bisecta]|uniref:Glycerol uptake facilitator protein n=1 Tax=[Myrmecia] bisecta TaxID=41462 RepID=A0AAW1QAB2_9CHLO